MTDLYTKGYRSGWKDAQACAAARIEALEAALREILDTADPYGVECIAKEVLAKGQDK